MSNLIHTLPSRLSVPPQPSPLSGSGLAVQPCFEPAPVISRPAPAPIAPTVEKARSADPEPCPSLRCSVKGCVFPVPAEEHAECRYHELLQSEGKFFESRQTSDLLSLYQPFGIPDYEPDDSRQQDRKRQAAERQEFLMDEYQGIDRDNEGC